MRRISAQHRSRFGVTLIIGGLVLNPWLIGYLVADDRSLQIDYFAANLLFSVGCILGGLQLLWRWVEPLSWGRQVGLIRGVTVVGLFAFVVAGSYWRIVTYNSAHNHVLVPSEHEHAGQQQWAEDFYQRSLAAARKHGWFDIDKALAQGFQADPINGTHFPNQQYMFDDVILDPERPEWLVYSDSPDGKVLMALMFFTRELEEVGPTPAGAIAQWHYHTYKDVRCAIKGLWTVSKADEKGQCAEGIPVTRTPEMLHVWFIDHPLGRFTEMNVVSEYWQEQGFDLRTLHPMTVHFAIALFMIAVLLDLTAVVTSKRQYHWAAWINLVLAAIAAVAAVGTGMTAEVLLKPTHEAHQTLDVHKLLGFGSLAGIVLLSMWRFTLRGNFPQKAASLYIVLSLAGVGLVGGASYYGGEMVYRHGAAVRAIDQFARERYWQQIRDVYRKEPGVVVGGPSGAAVTGHSGH